MSAPPLPPPPPPPGPAKAPPPAGSPGQRRPPAPPGPKFSQPDLASAAELERYKELLTMTLIDLQDLFNSSLDPALKRLQLLFDRLNNVDTVPNVSGQPIHIRRIALAKQQERNATDTQTSIRVMQSMIENWNNINISPPKQDYAVIIQFVLRRLIDFIPDDPDPIDALDALLHYVQYARVFTIGDIVIPSRPILSLDEANRMRAVGRSSTQVVNKQKLGNKPPRPTRHAPGSYKNITQQAPLGMGPNQDLGFRLARTAQNAPRANMLRLASPNSGAALATNMRNTRRLQNNHRPFGNQGENRGQVVGLPTNRQDLGHQPLLRNRHAPGSYDNVAQPAFLGSHLPPFWKSRLARRTQHAPRANMVRLASPNSGAALATNVRNTRRLQNNHQPQLTGNYRPSLLSTLVGRLQQPQPPNRSQNLIRLRGLRTNDFAQAQVLGMGPVQKEVARLTRADQAPPPPVNRAVGAMENAAMHNDAVEYGGLAERLEVLKDEISLLVDFLSKPDITEEDRGKSMERLRVVDAEYTTLHTILLQNQHQSPEEVRQRAALANAGTEAGRLGAERAPARPDNGPNDDPPPANQGGGQRGTRHRKAGRSPRRAPAPQQPRNNRYVPPTPPNATRKKLNHPPGKLGLMQRLLLGASLLAPGVGGPMKVRWRPSDTPGPPLLPPRPMGKQVAVIPGEGVRDGGVEAVGRLIPGWGPYNGLGAVEERRRAGPLAVIPGEGAQGEFGPGGGFTGSYPGYGELTGPFGRAAEIPSNEPGLRYPGEAFLLNSGSPPLRHVPMGKQVAVVHGEGPRGAAGPELPFAGYHASGLNGEHSILGAFDMPSRPVYNGTGVKRESKMGRQVAVVPGEGAQGEFGPGGGFTGTYAGYGPLTLPFGRASFIVPENGPKLYPPEPFRLRPGPRAVRSVKMGTQVAQRRGNKVKNYPPGNELRRPPYGTGAPWANGPNLADPPPPAPLPPPPPPPPLGPHFEKDGNNIYYVFSIIKPRILGFSGTEGPPVPTRIVVKEGNNPPITGKEFSKKVDAELQKDRASSSWFSANTWRATRNLFPDWMKKLHKIKGKDLDPAKPIPITNVYNLAH